MQKLESRIDSLTSYIPVYEQKLADKNHRAVERKRHSFQKKLLQLEINAKVEEYFESLKTDELSKLEDKLYWELRKLDNQFQNKTTHRNKIDLKKRKKVDSKDDESNETSVEVPGVQDIKLSQEKLQQVEDDYQKKLQEIINTHDLEVEKVIEKYNKEAYLKFLVNRHAYYLKIASHFNEEPVLKEIPNVIKEDEVSNIIKVYQELYDKLVNYVNQQLELESKKLTASKDKKVSVKTEKSLVKKEKLVNRLAVKKEKLEVAKANQKTRLIDVHEQASDELKEDYAKVLELYNEENDSHLLVRNLLMQFGGLKAVDQLSFTVKRKEIFGLIGPNGAGKTTVFNCITQFYKPTSGLIYFKNRKGEVLNLVDYKVHDIIRQGIVRTFQNVELIWELSILDNLLVGAHTAYQTSFLEQLVHWPSLKKEEEIIRAKAINILTELNLIEFKDQQPIGLPYGTLKRIELARTLMLNPELIILDEPAAGLNETETIELSQTIKKIREKFDVTIFLVEHDMGLVMDVCDTICAISFGRLLAIGTPDEIQANPLVQEAYLGGE